MSDNAIYVIHPYKHKGVWVFDDESRDLVKEPFVSGMPDIIDKAVADIPNASDGFILFFSGSNFPGANIGLTWIREEYGGNWYKTDNGMIGWLCPALFKYFRTVPKKIYGRVEAKR